MPGGQTRPIPEYDHEGRSLLILPFCRAGSSSLSHGLEALARFASVQSAPWNLPSSMKVPLAQSGTASASRDLPGPEWLWLAGRVLAGERIFGPGPRPSVLPRKVAACSFVRFKARWSSDQGRLVHWARPSGLRQPVEARPKAGRAHSWYQPGHLQRGQYQNRYHREQHP